MILPTILPRFVVIVLLLARHIPGTLPLLVSRVRGSRSTVITEKLGKHLADILESLGPTFIKVGQILGSRRDLAPDGLLRPLRRLQDDVLPIKRQVVLRIMASEFASHRDDLFEDFDPTPVAAGSIAQVHRARLRESGIEVALKIKRPGVGKAIETDLQLLRFIAKLLSLFPRLRGIPIIEALDEVGKSIQQQTDFKQEVRNGLLFAKEFAQISGVIVPKPIAYLCTNDVIVMEFIDGLCRFDDQRFGQANREWALETALDCLYRMIFTLGVIHCDLHPGNLMLNHDGDVVILDQGLVAEFDSTRRGIFLDFFLAIAFNEGKQCARILINTASIVGQGFDESSFYKEICLLIARVSTRKANEFQVSEFAIALFDIQRSHQMRGSTDFMMAILSLLVFEGLAKQSHPCLDFQRQAVPFLATALSRRVGKAVV